MACHPARRDGPRRAQAIAQMLPTAVGVALTIMAVLLLILGVKLIGDAITGRSW